MYAGFFVSEFFIIKPIHLIYFRSRLLRALIGLIIKKAHQNEKINYRTAAY